MVSIQILEKVPEKIAGKALHNLIEQFDIQFCKEHGSQQSAEFVSNVLQKRLFNEKTKMKLIPMI